MPGGETLDAHPKIYVNLKVKGQDGCSVHFKINRTTALKKLMEAYCAQQGFEMSTICFFFDGMRVCETQTPAELNMEDDDVIESGDDEEGGDANVPLHLKVKGQDGCFDAKRVCETQTPAEVNIQDGAVIGAGEVLEGTFKRLQGQTGELEDIGALLTAD